jgi:rubrerythrin
MDAETLVKSFNNTILIAMIESAKYEKHAYNLTNHPRISALLKNFAEMEKRHASVFYNLSIKLGGTPDIVEDTLHVDNTPGDHTEQETVEILRQHVRDEEKAIKLYDEYKNWVSDKNIKRELKIILIEKNLHLVTLKELIKELDPWSQVTPLGD